MVRGPEIRFHKNFHQGSTRAGSARAAMSIACWGYHLSLFFVIFLRGGETSPVASAGAGKGNHPLFLPQKGGESPLKSDTPTCTASEFIGQPVVRSLVRRLFFRFKRGLCYSPHPPPLKRLGLWQSGSPGRKQRLCRGHEKELLAPRLLARNKGTVTEIIYIYIIEKNKN